MDELTNSTDSGQRDVGIDGLADLVRREMNSPSGRWRLAGFSLSVGLLVNLYWENLKHFTFVWSNDDNYSHGWLVGPLSLFFANMAAGGSDSHRNVSNDGIWTGSILIALGILGRLISVFLPIGLIADGSMILCLSGVVFLIYGRKSFARYRFPILFLVFMIPLPVALYTMLANPLQLVVSRFASTVMTRAGIPVLCEGNMMTLPGGIQMFVAEACSGMRQLTGFLALTAAVAYLSGKPLWYRLILVLSAIPVAMIANIARVIVTGLIMYYINPEYAKGAWHTVEGMALMVGGLALLQLEMIILNCLMDLFDSSHTLGDKTSEPVSGQNMTQVVTGAQA